MAKLYGISVGPGDPELLTLKALRCMQKVDVIAAAGKKVEDSVAYRIAAGACADIVEKEKCAVYMPMTKEEELLQKAHKEGADKLEKLLQAGKNVGFLVLGDAALYSTYYYLHALLRERGYETEMIAGVNSFCAAAARLGIDLASGEESLHIIPASYGVEEALHFSGTKVLMKSGKTIGEAKAALLAAGKSVLMVENCGMENEKIYRRAEDIPENAGYFSLLIVKD